MEKNKMSDKELLAFMYDFYNENTLINQNDDIKYYEEYIKFYNPKNTLVVGAGTGRVAIPLSKKTNVTALDFDSERLKILKNRNKEIKIINLNFNNIKFTKKYDLIVFPYSVIQFCPNMNNFIKILEKLKAILNENGTIILDFSEGFNTKEEVNRELLFSKFSESLNCSVDVYYTCIKHKKNIEFIVEYVIGDKKLIEREFYSYYNKNIIEKEIEKSKLIIKKIDNGYGNDNQLYKHIFHIGELDEK